MTVYLFSTLLFVAAAGWLVLRTGTVDGDGRVRGHLQLQGVAGNVRGWLLRQQARADLNRMLRDADPRVRAELLAVAQRES